MPNGADQIIDKRTKFPVDYSEYPKKKKVRLIEKKKKPIAKK